MSDVHVLVSPEAGRGRAAGTAADVLDRLRALGGHVIDLLFDLQARAGTTLMLITHDPALALRCQRRLELADGRLRRGGDLAVSHAARATGSAP